MVRLSYVQKTSIPKYLYTRIDIVNEAASIWDSYTDYGI